MMDDFYLFANCNFVPDRYADWQAAYDDLARYVYASEPTTKTYYFGIPIDYAHDVDKTTSMFAFEVYGTKDDLYKTHLASAAMSTFLSKIDPLTTTNLDLHHYKCVAGSLHPPRPPPALPPTPSHTQPRAEIMQDTRITCTSASTRASTISALTTLVDNVHASLDTASDDDGVLTYMAFESLDDDVGVRIFGRWGTRAGFEAFVRRGDVGGFWARVKHGVAGMEQRLYVPNGKGWLRRGERGRDGVKHGGLR